ncbi:MAG: hypothetical protein IKM88_11445 [Lachnospiraceae bacterium]|nr:hypothetical protein [Clostridiales bacterium]MBR6850842.1 hypothetical protein [Lachnospiraceae bacterium]
MACFIVPAAEAIVTTIAAKVLKKHEVSQKISHSGSHDEIIEKTSFSRKLGWLNNLLWGGSALLALEHVWHGEVVPWFPFLTAAGDPESKAEMLHEMSTVGVTMALLVTAVWAGMVIVSSVLEKKAAKLKLAANKK